MSCSSGATNRVRDGAARAMSASSQGWKPAGTPERVIGAEALRILRRSVILYSVPLPQAGEVRGGRCNGGGAGPPPAPSAAEGEREATSSDRKSVVEGKSVSVRVDLGGWRLIKK